MGFAFKSKTSASIHKREPDVGSLRGRFECCRWLLLVSSWALYLVKPLRRTFSPSSSRNSSSAGPAVSLLYISSSVLWPARQYITPTFTWKLSWDTTRVGKEKAQKISHEMRRAAGGWLAKRNFSKIKYCKLQVFFLMFPKKDKVKKHLPLVHPVSSVALWLWACWEPVGGRRDPAQGEGTPAPLWWAALGWCRA